MHTLRRFASRQLQVPASTAWYLSDLGEFRGKQELYTRQSPQRLKVLREHALIESAVSSNRIEGVAVEASRIREVLVAPKPLLRDRDEEEVRGYRDALAWIHGQADDIGVTEATIKQLHATARGQIWDAGMHKEKDGDIIERHPDGRERVKAGVGVGEYRSIGRDARERICDQRAGTIVPRCEPRYGSAGSTRTTGGWRADLPGARAGGGVEEEGVITST